MKLSLIVLLLFIATWGIACGNGGTKSTATPTEAGGGQLMTIALTSPAFAAGEPIPAKYTCDGESVSPPLQWEGVPAGAQSLALILDDPDAPSGTFVHWVIYDLPPDLRSLPEAVPTADNPPQGGTNGKNGANATGYTGPCPPSGMHRYFFRLYALDSKLDGAAAMTKDQLSRAMEGHILAQGELMGTYARSK